jgi:hypothetical protein
VQPQLVVVCQLAQQLGEVALAQHQALHEVRGAGAEGCVCIGHGACILAAMSVYRCHTTMQVAYAGAHWMVCRSTTGK